MRYDLQVAAPAPGTITADLGFVSLNMKDARETLQPGVAARLENKRLKHGAETRPGTRTPLFANTGTLATEYLGSGIYKNPNGYEMLLLASDQEVFGARSGTLPITIAVENDFTGGVEFTQHFDKVLAHQADPGEATQIWDGRNADDGFIPVIATLVGSGFAVIPNPPWSVNYLSRAWFPIPGSQDSIGASDINNPTTYDSDLHTFRVNTGSADAIIGIYPYLLNNLIVAKERSIDILTDIPGDLGDAYVLTGGLGGPPPARTSTVSKEIGVYARKSGIVAGGRFMFLSNAGGGGIYQVATDQHGNYVVDPTPVSDMIEPLIFRINWKYAQGAVAGVSGKYAHWAVPIDGATYNNAMLVLDLATGQWQGLDLWTAEPRDIGGGVLQTDDNPMRMDALHQLNFYGTAELFAVNNADGKVHMLGHGTDDQLNVPTGDDHLEEETYKIQDVLETRGYFTPSESGALRESKSAHIGLGTLEPSLTIVQMIDGSNGDERTFVPDPILRDRTKYETDRAPFDITNTAGTFEDAPRRDYAIHLGDHILLGDGVRAQRVWPWTQDVSLDAQARFVSFRISNDGGIAQVRNVIFDSTPTRSIRSAQ